MSNVVNINVVKFGKQQHHGRINHLLSGKRIKIEKERGICHIRLL